MILSFTEISCKVVEIFEFEIRKINKILYRRGQCGIVHNLFNMNTFIREFVIQASK